MVRRRNFCALKIGRQGTLVARVYADRGFLRIDSESGLNESIGHWYLILAKH